MKIPGKSAAALIAVGILLSASQVLAQESGKEKNGKPRTPPGQEEIMKKWMEVATPAEGHKKLDDLAGTWDVEMTTWGQGPESAPAVSRGSEVNSWVLGGRFLRQELKGEMMGMPFEGVGYIGYDNYNKKYIEFWIDNSSTQMSTMSGGVDHAGKVFTFYGTMDEWMTGENGKPFKYVTRILSKDKYTFEIHDLSVDGPNTKIMEMVSTRKK